MGFSVSSTPSYLYQSTSGYIFRLRVPNDLRDLVGKSEFRYSLRTGAMRVARQRARSIASYIQQLFLDIRNAMSEWTQEKINQVVQRYIRETLANDELCRSLPRDHSGAPSTLPGKTLLEASGMQEKESESLLMLVDRWLKNQYFSPMEPVLNRVIHDNGNDVEPDSITYHVLSRELLKAFQSILKVRIERSKGDYSKSDEELIPQLKQQPQADFSPSVSFMTPSGEEAEPSVFRFTEVQERYLAEVEIGENWTKKTKAENISIFELFVRVEGDLPVKDIDRQLMSGYKACLMRLPPNLNKNKLYQGKSIKEICALKPEKTLSVNTINKYLRRLSGLFNFAVKNGYMTSNPAEGLQIKSQKRADQEREAYTEEDLKKLFGSKEYTEELSKHSYQYWTPLIALYTGCRLEEICQLHLDDIRQEGGVWVFDINDEEEKRVKTLSSKRLVPLHPRLIEVGLLEYVADLRNAGERRLFPELHQQRDGYGQQVSKWFQRYKKRCGISKGKTFHSFRHTFITHLKYKQVDPFMIHELDGHTVDSQTMGRYGKRYTPDILLKEAIEKIDYGQIP